MQVIIKIGMIAAVSLGWPVMAVATDSKANLKADLAQATAPESVPSTPAGENTAENAAENAGEDTAENAGEDTAENAGEDASDRDSLAAPPNPSAPEDAGENTVEDAANHAGEDAEEDAGEDASDRDSLAAPPNPSAAEDATEDASSDVALKKICAPVAQESELELNVADPSIPSSWLNQGQYLLRTKRYEEALMAYHRAIGLDANEADGWIGCGVALEMLAEYEKAIQALDRAIEINPEHSLAWFNRGKVLKQSGKYEEALTAFDRSLQGNSEWGEHTAAEVWVNRGSVLSRLDILVEAIAAFDKAIELDPEYALAWFNQGTVFLKQGVALARQNDNDGASVAFQKAVDSYNRALASQGKWGELRGPASAWYNRGIALERLEQYEDAIESYDQALKIIPNHTKARQRLVALRERLE